MWHQYLTTHLDKVSLVRDHNLVALLQLNVGDDALVCDHDLAQRLNLASLVDKLHDQLGLFGTDGRLTIRTGRRGEYAALQPVERFIQHLFLPDGHALAHQIDGLVIGQIRVDRNMVEQIVQLGLFADGEVRGAHITAGDLHIVNLCMHVIVKQHLVAVLELDLGKIFVRQINREGTVCTIANDPDMTHLGEGQGIIDQFRTQCIALL